MIFRLTQRTLVLLGWILIASPLLGCGGGGSSDEPGSGGGGDGAVHTFGDSTLPGRLLVNAPDGRAAQLFDLSSGDRQALPDSAKSAEADRWTASADGTVLLRWNTADWRTAFPVSFFQASSLSSVRMDLDLGTELDQKSPLLSPDKTMVLSYFGDGATVDERLTIFNSVSGEVLKRGSQLDDADVITEPYAWLPDGSYVYLSAQKIYTSSATSSTSRLLATLALPNNNVLDGGGYVAGHSSLAVSPDGTKLAFTWWERRNSITFDNHIYVVNLDGSDLRRLTAVADPNDALSYGFGSPTWSPDGQWLGFVLFMSGTTASPVWPDEPFLGGRVTGTTGCSSSPVYVLPANGPEVAFAWPALDRSHAVKVKDASGSGGQWVSSCGRIRWLP